MTIARRPIASIEQVDGLQGALNLRPQRNITHIREYPAVPVALFEADEAWTAGTAITTEPYVGFGKQSLLVTSTGSNVDANLSLAAAWAWDFSTYPMHEFLFYVDDASKLEAVSFFPSIDSSMTRYFSFVSLNPNQHQPFVNGWNMVRMTKVDMYASAGATDADWANINYLKVRVKATTGNTVNVYFAAWRVVAPPAIVFLDHDDGASSCAAMWAIEEKYGLRSTNYVNPNRVGTTGYVTWAQLWDAYEKGHDVCNHTWDHEQLSTLDAAGKLAAVAKGWKALIGRGFTRSARFFASPYGETSADIITAVSSYHSTNRPAGDIGIGSKYPSYNEYTGGHRYNNLSVTDTPDIATVTGWVDALSCGRVIHLLAHAVDVGPESYKVTSAFYDALCAHIAASDVVCMTMSEFYDQGLPIVGPNPMRYSVGLSAAGATALTRSV